MKQQKQFPRVNTRVTRLFKQRLQWACERREQATARRVPEGEILSEFAASMEPHPDEDKPAAAGAARKEPKRESGKRRTPKPAKPATSIAAA
jgi:hypothetical protein